MKLAFKNFKAGVYITVESKLEGNYFYVIRKGRVRISSTVEADSDKGSHILGAGDFFAVISCMTGQPRLASAFTLEDVQVLEVKKNQFGFLIEKSAPLALKIIRSFSNDLREYDEMLVSKTLKHDEVENPEVAMKKTAEYYIENKEEEKAMQVYLQFLKNNPRSAYVPEVVEKLQGIDKNLLNQVVFPKEITRTYLDGKMIFCDNELGSEMYIIEYGKVKITKILNNKEALIAVLNPGDVFGEMALLNNKLRTASAVAYGDVKCTAFNTDNFNIILRKNTQLGIRIITLLSERIWTIYKQLDNLFFSDYKGRIYDILLTHLLKNRVNLEKDTRFNFPYGIGEVEKMMGAIDREKLDEALATIRKNGIIIVENEKLICTSVQALFKEVNYARKMELRQRKIDSSKSATTTSALA